MATDRTLKPFNEELLDDPIRYLCLAVILKALEDEDWTFIFTDSDDRTFWIRGALMKTPEIERAGRFHWHKLPVLDRIRTQNALGFPFDRPNSV